MSIKKFSPKLSAPRTVDQLARALGISTPVFEIIAQNKEPEDLYFLHRIPKRAPPKNLPEESSQFPGVQVLKLPDFRLVWEPRYPQIRLAHRSAAGAIDSYLMNNFPGYPHDNSYGYVRGRSTKANAARHLGARRLLGVDIKDYFPSIKIGKIELALRMAGFDAKVTKSLASFLTINGGLPLGLNASPTIANLVSHKMDVDFTEIANSIGCVYTRYADDLTFSGLGDLPSREMVDEVLRKHDFVLNVSKYRESKRGQRHYVTGLSVADKAAPHIPRKIKRRLRQELFFIKKFGLDNHVRRLHGEPYLQNIVNRIDGTVSYVASIEKRTSHELKSAWAEICLNEKVERSFSPRPYLELRDSSWFVDEAEILMADGARALAVCAVEIHGDDHLDQKLASFFEDEAGDAYGQGSSDEMRKKGIHWSYANLSQRERAVKLLSICPVRAFIAINYLGSSDEYSSLYMNLLRRVLDVAFKTCDDAIMKVFIESNSSKVSGKSIVNLLEGEYKKLVEKNERRPLDLPQFNVVDKGFRPCLVVPDVILGALGGYIQHAGAESKGKNSIQFLLFEHLRRKIEVIFDDRVGVIFNSRNPFKVS